MSNDISRQTKNILAKAIRGELSYVMACEEIDSLLSKELKEKEAMRRKIYGLETTVRNFKEKQQKRYREMSWRED